MMQFIKPKFTLSQDQTDENYKEFEITNLERGMATSLGVALRRALLSSVPALAVYALKINGVSHEFDSLKGVKETILEIVLNIKALVLRTIENVNFNEEEIDNLILNVKGEKVVTAADIICPPGIEVVNQDLIIANTTDRNEELLIEFYVKKSRGYASFEENKKLINNGQGIIAIDADFSPIKKVTYKIEPLTKTIKGVDYEKLILGVKTNGSINPAIAVAVAAKILQSHLELFINLKNEIKNFEVINADENKENDELNLTLEDLNLTARSYNGLKRQGIRFLRDIIKLDYDSVRQIKNLGQKSIEELENLLKSKNLSFARKN